ncbi:MAG TPA: ABC transporter permease [Candidatus Limiplasma pullistercoris]|nr:ABC transporter permease [Candidatus Limiplasma pullistercoris]
MIKKRKLSQQMNGVLTIYGLLLVVFAVMCLVSESFRSLYNITNLITQCVPLACVALGQTLVIISGGIDMSVGSTISVCTCVAAKLMNTDSPAQVAFGAAAVVLTGVAVGLINGAGINFAKVPPMITTLCTSTALSGVALWILPMAGGKVNSDFARFVYRKWTIVSFPLIVMLVLFLVMRTLLHRTRTGVDIYAIGRDPRIAKTMGVNVRAASMKTYMLCGLCAGITGLLLACRMRVGDPTCGTVYSMDSITAAVVGGTSMAGGVGLLSGTVAGAFLIGMLSNIMNSLAVNQFYQYVVKGGLLVLAMVIYSVSKLMEVKRHAK